MKKISTFSRKFFGIWFSIAATGLFVVYFCKAFTIEPRILYTAFFIAGAVALLLATVWQWNEKQFPQTEKLYATARLVIAAMLAGFFFFYAMGKLFELQFVVMKDTLAKPTGELSGFEKAWLFFGHSGVYNYFIASGQVLAALLLLLRKTRTSGAILYFFIMANITVIDFSYGITAMQDMAVLLLAMSVYLIACDGKRVKAFFLSEGIVPDRSNMDKLPVWQWTIVVLVVLAGIINDYIFFHHVSSKF